MLIQVFIAKYEQNICKIVIELNRCDRWTLLSERALELLKEYWKSYSVKRDHLFVSLDVPHDSLKIRGVEIMLRAVGRNAGIRVHPHMLRHSFASHMIEQGVPIHFVQSMLGHRSLSSTQIYIHVSSKAVMGMRSPLDRPNQKKDAIRPVQKDGGLHG